MLRGWRVLWDYPSRRVIEGARNTLRAALNNAMREELISRNVAELVTLPKARKKLQRRNSWTVDEARRFLESSRRDNDPLYALWVLILVMGLRRGEAMGLVDDDTTIDEASRGNRAGMAARARRRIPAHAQAPAQGRRQRRNPAATANRARRAANRAEDPSRTPYRSVAEDLHMRRASSIAVHHEHRQPSSRGTSSAALTHVARRPEYGRSRFTTRAARAAHCSPRSTFTRVSRWRFSGTAG